MECFDGQTHLMIANKSFRRGHLKNGRVECQVDGDELQQTAFFVCKFFRRDFIHRRLRHFLKSII